MQRGDAVALLRQVLQPFAEKGVHPQAVVQDALGWREHADHVLPATSRVAMRRLDLPRIAVQAQAGGRIGQSGLGVDQSVAHAQLGGIGVLLDGSYVAVASIGSVGPS